MATGEATRAQTASAARIAAITEFALGTAVEGVAGALVLLETVVLLAGVVARKGLDHPLTWSDELASILFLWLASLGAAVAYRRGEHMRMGALVDRAPRRRAFAEALALVAGLAFLLLLAGPAYDHFEDAIDMNTSALEISDAWRVAAFPVGTALMLVFGLLRIVQRGRWLELLGAIILVVGIAAGLELARPLLAALGNGKLVVFFVVLVGACVLSGIPIAFAFGLGTLSYLALTTRTPLSIVAFRMDEGMSHLILLAVPLFVYLGLLIEIAGMGRRMVAFLASLLGHVRGGLHYVLVAGMYLVSGISGSKAADMAAIAPVLFPEMRGRGADDGELVALLAATGAQTETVPPSLVLITIGSVTGVSISALFTGGLLPSLLLGLVLCGVIAWHSRGIGARLPRASAGQIGRTLLAAFPALLLPFVIRTTVVEGVATATEVSTIGIAYVLVYAAVASLLFGERVAWRRILPALVDTACLSGAILLIIGTATAMAWALTQSGFSRQLTTVMAGLPGGSVTFLAASILVFLILGSVLEGIPAIVLFGPLLFPVARAVGVNEVHYAMVVILAMGIGLFTPPFGVGYYAACVIGRVDPSRGVRPILPYMLALLLGTVVIAAVPSLSTAFLR